MSLVGSKRARTSSGYAPGGSFARRRAIAINAKINKKFPYSTYGRAYIRRGSPFSLQQFGDSYRAADATQRGNRHNFGFYGRGLYTGRGLYQGRGAYSLSSAFKSIGRGIKSGAKALGRGASHVASTLANDPTIRSMAHDLANHAKDVAMDAAIAAVAL